MFPVMSFLTGVKATLPRSSNRVVVASAASRNSLVAMPWSLGSIGTSAKDRLCVSNQVCPGRMSLVVADMAVRKRLNGVGWERGGRAQGKVAGEGLWARGMRVNRVRSTRIANTANNFLRHCMDMYGVTSCLFALFWRPSARKSALQVTSWSCVLTDCESLGAFQSNVSRPLCVIVRAQDFRNDASWGIEMEHTTRTASNSYYALGPDTYTAQRLVSLCGTLWSPLSHHDRNMLHQSTWIVLRAVSS